jgi:inositol phosphorylceramide mannosyltransferase catalytic subunit
MPPEFMGYRETWLRHLPDWEMHLWTEENLPADLVRKEAYERLRNPAERSDILRLEVLFRFGGVYVDTDIECLRPIDPLLEEGANLFVGYIGAHPPRVQNAVIAAEAGHPALEQALRELRPVTEFGIDKHGTGPHFLTRVLREHPEVTIYPQEVFYPMTDAERERAYAVHHDAASWKTPELLKARAQESQRKLAEARKRNEELEALVGLRGASAGIKAWRSALRVGERLRRTGRSHRRAGDRR